MPIVSVRLPQMGEGLQEALLVQFIKKPGDMVRRDEPLYVMETDKATTDVESPYSGRLVEWKVAEGSVLPIGTEVALMEVDSPVPEQVTSHGAAPTPTAASDPIDVSDPDGAGETVRNVTSSGVTIPPRTRKYLKEKGLLDQIDSIPCAGSKLMPDDVDRYLRSKTTMGNAHAEIADNLDAADVFDEHPVSKQQLTLNYRLTRSTQTTVPVVVMCEVDWSGLDHARKQVKLNGGTTTSFAMMLWCVVKALERHPRFRTNLTADGTKYRTFRHVNLGVAVALPGDALLTAALKKAETFERNGFFGYVEEQVSKARQGEDQADASITLSVSNIGSASMRFGIPAIVSPAVATLALGEVFDAPVRSGEGIAWRKKAQLTLAFDHRIINGVGAADFMNDLKKEIESFVW